MPTTLRDSDEAKRKLEAIKRDDETFEELLDRLASQARTHGAGCLGGNREGGARPIGSRANANGLRVNINNSR